jgi:hypothetical protein
MTGQINVNKIAARTGTTITIDTGDALDVNLVKGEGTNTTNLKQGLLKSWSFFDVTTDDIHDSFNIASLTDNGSGATTTAYTNNMASINYAPLGGATHDGGLYGCYMPLDHDTPPTTSQVDFDHMKPWSSSGERVDQELCVLHISGDLA